MADQHHSPQRPPEIVLHDAGGWLSGPSRDVRHLTTREKTAAALAVPCPVHDVAPGELCPAGTIDGACMARRTAALGDSN